MGHLAWISQDAIFGAIVTFGLLLLGGVVTGLKRSWSNADGIERIEKLLESTKVIEMRSQVDELWMDRRETWTYLRQRGDQEAVNHELGQRRSPLGIKAGKEDFIMALYEPFVPELTAIAAEIGGNEDQLFEAIAKRLGGKFLNTVCPALNTDKGACISMAVGVLRNLKLIKSTST